MIASIHTNDAAGPVASPAAITRPSATKVRQIKFANATRRKPLPVDFSETAFTPVIRFNPSTE